MGREAIVFYCRLADHLFRHGSTSYSHTLAFIRCTLSFSLLRSAIYNGMTAVRSFILKFKLVRLRALFILCFINPYTFGCV